MLLSNAFIFWSDDLTVVFTSETFFFFFAAPSSVPFGVFLFFSWSFFFFLSSYSAIRSGQSKFASGSQVFSELEKNIQNVYDKISTQIQEIFRTWDRALLMTTIKNYLFWCTLANKWEMSLITVYSILYNVLFIFER